ncbi:MAG TPA: hypothetical protein PK821_02690 [Victivallales bacterium]|nr:hypothetical protein [Victivallales bacterium]
MKKMYLTAILTLLAGFVAIAEEDVFSDQDSKTALSTEQKHERVRSGQAYMVLERLKKSDPQKFEELKKLREENPEEYNKKLKELANESTEKIKKEREEISALMKKYRESGSEEDRAALKAKIEANMKERLEMQKQRLSEMEEKLAQLKVEIEENSKNIDAKIEERLNAMLKGREGKEDGAKTKKSQD